MAGLGGHDDHDSPTPALLAYERLAPVYDDFTAGYDHDALGRAGSSGSPATTGCRRRACSTSACGTGKSFAPLLARGYDVCGVRHLARDGRARAHAPRASIPSACVVADMRELPELGAFDLVTCLDDAVNYLLDAEDLARRVRERRARCSRPAASTSSTPTRSRRTAPASPRGASFERPLAAAVLARRDDRRRSSPGALCVASIEIAGRTGARSAATSSATTRSPSIRHALASAGLACRAVLGQSTGGVLHEDADEDAHTKLVYVAGRAG